MKEARQEEILRIITEMEVETQEQLLEELSRRGIQTTQATVSRDIKQLHISKALSERGVYRYTAPGGREAADREKRLCKIFRQCVVSFDFAQNIVVVNTMPGLASAAAAALDGMEQPDMVGSLAGDDTAILIMRTAGAAERFCQDLHTMLQ
ncbi:MAG: arginine repressor [Oscillospiraceae bacterium]|nr:arginine repressor [Oscillospiraceae bacterium]